MTIQQEKAEQVQQTYQADVAKISSNLSLTKDAKKIRIAKRYVQALDELSALQEQQEAGTTGRRAELEQKIFGMPAGSPTADVVSYRDALDRVSRIEPTDQNRDWKLNQLYETAKISADTILIRAILAQAFALGATAIIEQYIDDNPNADNDISELWTLRTSRRTNLIANFIFIPNLPTELAGLNEFRIRDLATQPAPAIA